MSRDLCACGVAGHEDTVAQLFTTLPGAQL